MLGNCGVLLHLVCCAVLCLSAAIVPPAVTRERGNPLTLALQSALVPAQVSWTWAGTLIGSHSHVPQGASVSLFHPPLWLLAGWYSSHTRCTPFVNLACDDDRNAFSGSKGWVVIVCS